MDYAGGDEGASMVASGAPEAATSQPARADEQAAGERARRRAAAVRVGRALVALYVASLLLYLAVVFLTLMTVYILGQLIEPWMGAAIVGSTLLLVSIAVLRRAVRYVRAAVDAYMHDG
jgi:hypothetical protein